MPLKTHLDEQPTLNLTPMIDVVFNLIIFFMVATRFAAVEQKLDVKVPQVSDMGATSATPAKFTVHVMRDGSLALDKDPVSLELLAERLRAARRTSRDVSVVVRGDGEGAFQYVAGVLAACRKAGVVDLGISVRTASTPGKGGTASRPSGATR